MYGLHIKVNGQHCAWLKYFCKDFQPLCWTMETGELFKKNIENIKNSTFNFVGTKT